MGFVFGDRAPWNPLDNSNYIDYVPIQGPFLRSYCWSESVIWDLGPWLFRPQTSSWCDSSLFSMPWWFLPQRIWPRPESIWGLSVKSNDMIGSDSTIHYSPLSTIILIIYVPLVCNLKQYSPWDICFEPFSIIYHWSSNHLSLTLINNS